MALPRWLLAAVAAFAVLVGACSDAAAPPAATPAATSTPAAEAETRAPASPSPAAAFRPLGTSAGVATTPRDPAFSALPGASAHYGILGRAAYRIEIPDAWNGELVLYAHGFAGFGTEVAVENPPRALREHLIAGGFAWAASSYSENGYVPGIGADDTLALLQHLTAEFGKPARTYLVGASMGGNVVALALENHPGVYDGGLALCGALGGIEQIDYLVSWVALAEYFSGLTFPIGVPGADLTSTFLVQLPLRLGTPAAPTAAGRAFASAVKHLTGGPRPFFAEGFAEQYAVNFGLAMLDPERRLLVNRAATNEGVAYAIDPGLGVSAEELNAGVRRFPADPAARNAEAHPDAVPTTGRLTAPLLTLHNTGDLFVPISLEQSYLAKARAAGTEELLVQRAIRAGGHCKFSARELTTAFDDLVRWVREGVRPAGDDLSGDLSDIGRQFTNPLRPGDPGTVN
ncbi:serine aminopeptidase domain-containing protein [Tepidiforma sp.]|uniref:serine aminopeptidase domain-containing protein n=1 Tax=Tepidiforma sp. TaxID=2682230 RepID=UPI002ADD456B|nr:alpha/beta hydrolase [Tepidiforma sp.]